MPLKINMYQTIIIVVTTIIPFFLFSWKDRINIGRIDFSFISQKKSSDSFIQKSTELFIKLRQDSYTRNPQRVKLLIERNNIIESSLNSIMYRPLDFKISKQICVKFVTENGIDERGLTKEWISLLTKNIFDPQNDLFYYPSEDKNKMLPVDKAHIRNGKIEYYELLGIVIGRMIFSRIHADIKFHDIVWKLILDLPLEDTDYKKIDPIFYKNFTALCKDSSVLTELNIKFEENGYELIENGSNIAVNESNIQLYIQEYLKYKYVIKIKDQCDAIKKGLFRIIPKKLFIKFSAKDIDLLANGSRELDVEKWIKYTRLYTYNSKDEEIIWFWEIVREFSEEEKQLLLHFVTGLYNLPPDGFINKRSDIRCFNFNITKMKSNKDKNLPIAFTCYNNLSLPSYSSKNIMKEKILLAINEGSEGYYRN